MSEKRERKMLRRRLMITERMLDSARRTLSEQACQIGSLNGYVSRLEGSIRIVDVLRKIFPPAGFDHYDEYEYGMIPDIKRTITEEEAMIIASWLYPGEYS